MKTFKLSLLLFVIIITNIVSLNAQLKVLSNGTVKIGDNSNAKIESGTGAILQLKAPFFQLENTTTSDPAKIRANTGLQFITTGITLQNTSINFSPIHIQSNSQLIMTLSKGITMGSNDSLGFRIYTYTEGGVEPVSMVGGISIDLPPINFEYPQSACFVPLGYGNSNIGMSSRPILNVYSKYFYTVGGTAGVLTASDARLKKNITKISSVRDKIHALNVVRYDFVKGIDGKDVSGDKAYQNKVGLLAQEVKDIFPNVVYYLPQEQVYVMDYSALIPYLIKSDQEQQDVVNAQQELITTLQDKVQSMEQIIMELQGQVALLKKQSPSKTETTNEAHQLFQNAPNPFNQSTKIEYALSDNVSSAKLCIYDLNGKQLRCYNLNTAKGISSIEIRASDLKSGIYLYTLIVDNASVATKRMILTE